MSVSFSWGGLIQDVPGSFAGPTVCGRSVGVGVVGVGQGLGALGLHVGGGVKAEPTVAVALLYQGKKSWQCARAASIEPNRAGKPGRYFRVLNCASE